MFLSSSCLKRAHQPPLLSVSMRGWLNEACNKLDMSAPLFRGLRATSHGHEIHRYLVSLVLPGSSNALVVTGRIAADPNESLEDVARAGLRNILRNTNNYINDYNYITVQRWKEKYKELSEEFATLEAAHHVLTMTHEALQAELPESTMQHPTGSRSNMRGWRRV
ncbi:hypothetical protein PIB30_096488 [Stylosanthes scabra]|uniref:Uncharacterized protein n=1 Tax=Stylosanthes scabra TaxID=79078 RepID=A0ABU6TVJ5_9FABA|nr:hypothetical protein [Stylosanthes scabra]